MVSRYRSIGAVLLAVVSGVVRPAVAVEVSGRLEIDPNWSAVIEQRVAAQPNPGLPTGFWQVGNGAASVDPLPVDPSQEIGLLIRPVEKRDMDPTASGEPVIEARNVSFQPAVAFVADGMKLLIRNSDLFDHEFVVEDERGEALPLEPQEGGRAFRASFKTRGQYVVRCRLFPFMRAYVVVEAPGAARFVRPDQAGRVSFGDLAPGRYAITVFNATQIAATAPNPIAGWVASPCSVDVPEPLGAQPPPVQPGGP
ncbi:MAG: hypothetical protein QME96_04230, partial [Myxococcota bacterium]|nr:hypothetical protein [Myxococcota bacterium]